MRKTNYNADKIDEQVIRQLIREYMIKYEVPKVTMIGQPAKKELGISDTVLSWVKTIAGVGAAAYIFTNKDALWEMGTKVVDFVTAIPETYDQIKGIITSMSGALTSGAGIASLFESKQKFFVPNHLFEVDSPQQPKAPVYQTAYGNLLYTVKVEAAAKKNLEILSSSGRAIISLDRIVIDANDNPQKLERNLQEAKVKIGKVLNAINNVYSSGVDYPQNFKTPEFSWISAKAFPINNLSIPNNDAMQTEIAKKILTGSLIVAIYNAIKDDVLSLIQDYFDDINKIENAEVKKKFTEILKKFTADVINDMIPGTFSSDVKRLLF